MSVLRKNDYPYPLYCVECGEIIIDYYVSRPTGQIHNGLSVNEVLCVECGRTGRTIKDE